MTFRSRLVLAVAAAVVVAVLAAAAASYVAARSSLVGSVDGTLRASAESMLAQGRPLPASTVSGLGFQYVAPTGKSLYGGGIPVTGQVRDVAAGRAPSYVTTLTIGGAAFRELVVSAGTVSVRSDFAVVYTGPAALQLVLPLRSVNAQLTDLRNVLIGIALGGIAAAVMLAWLVGRTALAPLDELTSGVEEVAATTDVTRRLDPGGPDELGRLRRAFNHLLGALERSQRAQRQLVLDAGHELRTPLTSLRTNLEVVRELEKLPSEERRVVVDDILTQMGELTTLVADLSELARGEQRQQEPVTLRLDLVVEDGVAVATTHARSRDVRYELTTRPTWVRGQRDRIVRAVGNLLDNALKWSPEGGVVEVWCADGAVTVRDHGPGISDEDLPHVFDRFYRSAIARALPGSGLGLAIVAQVAQAEGGRVSAGNAPGGGAVFRLELPPSGPPDEDADADAE